MATMEESFDPFGIPELRSRLQGWLTLYGAYSRLEQLCVVSGTQQALQLIASLEVTQDSIVFVPEMCYLAAAEIFRDHGAHIRTLSIGSDGIDLRPLEQALKSKRVSLVYTMPNGLYPTGWSYSIDQKQKLVEWSQTYQFTLVEDDYYAGFYYPEKPPVSLLSLAKPTTPLYYLASFSHLTHPSFRLGMMVCPNEAVQKMERKKFLADSHTSTLNQHFLLKLFESESLEDSLSLKRAVYRQRRTDALVSCARWLPTACTYHPSDCGFSSWVTTPQKLGFSFFYACLEAGVLVMPDEAFSLTDTHAGFQINFAGIEAQYLDEGIRRIARVLHHLYRHR
ncbi:aminotransferase [Alicyclobacillus fastidiosus]|nr:aminotransferase [Alicyclobacillus fastidiosus]